MSDVLILGTGAMALLFGGRLAAAGVPVTLFGSWEEGLSALEQDGVRVSAPDQEYSYPVAVARDAVELQDIKLALVLVKSWQSEQTARLLAQVLSPDGVVLTLQNGLGNLEFFTSHLGKNRAAGGVTTCGATLIGPGLIRPAGEGVVSVQEHPRLDPLVKILQSGGFSIEVVEDLSSLMWGKLVINVGINPLSALMGVPNGKLLESESAVEIMRSAAAEVVAVAKAKGININIDDPTQAVITVASATAENFSSMLQDIKRGAPTEIDFLCGAISRIGKSVDMPTPINDLLWQLIQSRVDLRG